MTVEYLQKIDLKNIPSNVSDINKKALNSQYFTPMEIGKYMSSMFKNNKKRKVTILDPGCGTGNLTLALISEICEWSVKPQTINILLFEIDYDLIKELNVNMIWAKDYCLSMGIELNYTIKNEDFIFNSVKKLQTKQNEKFDYIIMNPPYKKLGTESEHNRSLLKIKIDVPNYYAAFMALSCNLLNTNGQLVCIVPRSFCNGKYFEKFRVNLVKNYKLEQIHLFEDREGIFYDDVLQETLIISLTNKQPSFSNIVKISYSKDINFENVSLDNKRLDNIIFPTDDEKIIRMINEEDEEVVEIINNLPCTLDDIGIQVSTGPIVDFREKGTISDNPTLFSLPMIYSENISQGRALWPIEGKKPGNIKMSEENQNNLRPPGIYVLVKRMSAKEEVRRINAGIFNSNETARDKYVGFDNKVNYYHINKHGLPNLNVAAGLTAFLNSTLVDFYFRTYSGSTQVNVSDLKKLRYPTFEQLELLGRYTLEENLEQDAVDEFITKIVTG